MEAEFTIRPSLVFLIKDNLVCLALKKRGTGTGYLMGYGGGRRNGEGADYCAIRESQEESGIHIMTRDLERVGLLFCHNRMENGETHWCVVDVFITRFWVDNKTSFPFGKPTESDEMGPPGWYSVRDLPIKALLLGDQKWMPRHFPKMVAGEEKIITFVHYGPWQKTLDRPVKTMVVDTLPEV